MSEKRFVVKELNFEDTVIEDTVTKEQYNEYGVVELLNEQQNTIQSLQDLCGKSDYENAKLRLKNKELQGKIDVLCEERDYWKSKAMTLLMQVRRLTSRMTDKEVKEFNKELEEWIGIWLDCLWLVA